MPDLEVYHTNVVLLTLTNWVLCNKNDDNHRTGTTLGKKQYLKLEHQARETNAIEGFAEVQERCPCCLSLFKSHVPPMD